MKNPFRRGAPDSELDLELRHHLDLLEQEHLSRGLTAEDARLAALRDLGGLTRTKESYRHQRALPFLETLWQDLRFGVRSLKRTPGMTATLILTLMLGIGVNTALFSVIYTVLFKPLPYRDPQQLMWLSEVNDGDNLTGVDLVAIPDIVQWRARARSLSSITAIGLGRSALNLNDDAELIWGVYFSESVENILGVAPTLGRGFLADDLKIGAPKVVLLSDHLYRRRFAGDASVLGKSINFAGNLCTVVGVLPPDFRLAISLPPGGAPSEADILLNDPLDATDKFALGAIGRLRPGVTFETARAELAAILAASRLSASVASPTRQLRMRPLIDNMTGGSRTPLLILWAAVGFVLLVACVNVTNLLLARSAARSRETAIRMALGAGRTRLLRQLLTESLVLAFAGGAAGLLLASWVLRVVVHYGPAAIPRLNEVALDGNVLLFTIAVCAVTGIVSGIMPALSSAHAHPEEALKQSSRTASGPGRHARLHSALVICELTLALVLLNGAGLMLKSLWLMSSEMNEYAWDHVLTATVQVQNPQFAATGPERKRFLEGILAQIESLPGVRSAAFCIHILGEPLLLSGTPNPDPTNRAAGLRVVTEHYFQAAGAPLLAGRKFGDDDREDSPPVVIVNAAYARMYGLRDNAALVGRSILSSSEKPLKCGPAQPCTVVGVVDDLRSRPDDDPQPEVYLPTSQNGVMDYTPLYVRATGDPLALSGAIRKIVAQSPEAVVTGAQTLETEMTATIAPRRFQGALLAAFAGLALVLAMVGTYGVLAYAAAERTHEIGVRMALGAEAGDVLRMVLAHGASLTLAGVSTGLAASVALTRAMSGLLYGVKPADPSTCAAACALLMTAALLAAYIPARRAVSIDPILVLRNE